VSHNYGEGGEGRGAGRRGGWERGGRVEKGVDWPYLEERVKTVGTKSLLKY
jgi:hypothetical protein